MQVSRTRNMADDGDGDLAVAATIVLSALNRQKQHGTSTNSDAAFQSRDSKFLVQNRITFYFIEVFRTYEN